MSALSSIYIKKEVLEVMLDVMTKKDMKGIELTASINDESNHYGQNVSVYVSQSKEEREAGAKKFYVGNGSVFWTDGKITKGVRPSDTEVVQDAVVVDYSDPLPF
ncbi:MAG: hypothetical protein [Caudoviricetes sp.]|nr:MAG: hypothetical protein [Caudoviricetes sp.]